MRDTESGTSPLANKTFQSKRQWIRTKLQFFVSFSCFLCYYVLNTLQVGSRRVVQFGGLLMILFGLFGKFGALFVTIPEPVVGGMFLVMFGKCHCLINLIVIYRK